MKSLLNNPPKWFDVYPQGTSAGNEEQKFFIALSRSQWDWRSIDSLVKETGLTKDRVIEIIDKYTPYDVIIQNPNDPDKYGYWERTGLNPQPTKKKASVSASVTVPASSNVGTVGNPSTGGFTSNFINSCTACGRNVCHFCGGALCTCGNLKNGLKHCNCATMVLAGTPVSPITTQPAAAPTGSCGSGNCGCKP